MDREATPGVIADLLPGPHDVRGVGHGHRGLVQEPPPLDEVLLHVPRAVPEVVARPDGLFFQVPAQLLRFDGTDGCDEPPSLRAVDVWLARRGRLIDQPGAGGGAADAVLLVAPADMGQSFKFQFLRPLGNEGGESRRRKN